MSPGAALDEGAPRPEIRRRPANRWSRIQANPCSCTSGDRAKSIYAVSLYALYVTKVVQLSDEAYRRLRSRKRSGESFSDVVLRMTATGSLADLEGTMTAAEARTARKWIESANRLDRP